eukprot:CAMPEP_0197662484 /NCGR_PEP_ID=MMETSP1338-20131121/53621_1 /TAXON_ID=43686 ORGANISM="Pelagodinium beii, Strain RCC1491" /NCGR_SAMPLE_ID=MMETSP1338 /ASSEMBLY_ACC=CAM_ASM_000754 /LENGTH=32 /DNA_ID= /DNA_START= /DNA_END= /DNA_ORIENTATION=
MVSETNLERKPTEIYSALVFDHADTPATVRVV